MTKDRSRSSEELLTRGVGEVIERASLLKRLAAGRPLRVKLGIDPTGAQLHLGHAVALWKLRQFQELGHTIVLIIGDFTGQIGDPSGRNETRQPLSAEAVSKNARTYLDQISGILDVGKVEVRKQTEWYRGMALADFFRILKRATVPQLLAHETFRRRLETGGAFGVPELLYPLLQAYDSIMVRADVELGGADQKFNILTGRMLMGAFRLPPQEGMLVRYLVGLDGKMKMGKSLGNFIALEEKPEDMYGKVMSLPDSAIVPYFELVTRLPIADVRAVEASLKHGQNPRDAKAHLAREIVALYHSKTAAERAEAAFEKVFRKHEAPDEMPTVKVSRTGENIIGLLVRAKLAASKSEARRLVSQGAVRYDGKVIQGWDATIAVRNSAVLQVGKRKFVKIA